MPELNAEHATVPILYDTRFVSSTRSRRDFRALQASTSTSGTLYCARGDDFAPRARAQPDNGGLAIPLRLDVQVRVDAGREVVEFIPCGLPYGA